MSDRDLTPSERWMRDLVQRAPWPEGDAGPCPDDEILAARVEGAELRGMSRQALDAHLAGCDLCRHLVQDLMLDGAGEHLPSPASEPSLPAVRTIPWWSSALGALFPRRLVGGFAPVALSLVAVTALAAYAVPKAVALYEEAAQAQTPEPVEAVWTVTSKDERAAAPTPAPVAEPAQAAVAPDPAPTTEAPVAKARPVREAKRLRRAATAAPEAKGGTPAPTPVEAPTAILFNEPIQPAPVVKAEVVKEAPAPPPIPEKSAFTPADELFAEELGKVHALNFSRKYQQAIDQADKLLGIFRKPHEQGMLRQARKTAVRELKKIQGPCPSRYIQLVRKDDNTVVEMCVLPEDAERILD